MNIITIPEGKKVKIKKPSNIITIPEGKRVKIKFKKLYIPLEELINSLEVKTKNIIIVPNPIKPLLEELNNIKTDLLNNYFNDKKINIELYDSKIISLVQELENKTHNKFLKNNISPFDYLYSIKNLYNEIINKDKKLNKDLQYLESLKVGINNNLLINRINKQIEDLNENKKELNILISNFLLNQF